MGRACRERDGERGGARAARRPLPGRQPRESQGNRGEKGTRCRQENPRGSRGAREGNREGSWQKQRTCDRDREKKD